jgi:hypothetical protein
MSQDYAELVVQLVKELAKFPRLFHSVPFEQICNRVRPAIHFNSAVFDDGATMPSRALVLNLAVISFLWPLPQGVGEDADRPACSAHVLNLTASHPVVNRAPAHPYDFAGLHD